MQLKNFYPKMSILGIATVMALTACSDENPTLPQVTDPNGGIFNPTPGSSSDMTPTSSDAVIDPTSSSAVVVDPSTLPAEGPITQPAGLGILVDDFEDGDNLSKINDYWYTYNDNDNGGASIITTPLNEEENIIPGRVNNGSNYALQVNYTLDRGEYAYDPYVGWGVQVAPDEANGRFGGLTYWYKGGAHEVHVEITDVEDYDVHLALGSRQLSASRISFRAAGARKSRSTQSTSWQSASRQREARARS